MEMPDLLRRVFSGPGPTRALIEASAGTGKTFTIEHLVLDRVRAGVPIAEILLVTFTRKAAAELRERVRLRLIREAGGNPQVLRALAAFDSATITTIHGFAQLALTSFSIHTPYPYEQELAPLEDLLRGVVRELIRGRWYRDPLASSLLERWLAGSTLDKLTTILQACVESSSPLRFQRDLEAVAAGVPAALTTPQARQAFEIVLTTAAAKASRPETYREFVSGLLEHTATWQDCLMFLMAVNGNTLRHFINYCEKTLNRLGPGQREALESWLALAGSLKGRRTYRDHMTVMVLLPAVREALEAVKRDRHLMTYTDMIQRLARALSDPQTGPELVRALQGRYRVGIVDEFQDTDPAQWEILKRLFLERDDGALVVVGDPKQAIYRFRGADILTYQAARRHLLDAGGAQVHLDANYRCTADMVGAINQFFGGAGPESVFTVQDVRYDHPVTCGKLLRLAPHRAPVVILGQRFCPHLERSSWEYGLARQIAREIRDLVASGTRIEGGEGAPRSLDYRDIFILVQKHAEGRVISGILREEGIPFSFYKRQTLFDGPEARALLDVLEAVLRPQHPGLQNRAFVTPFFGLKLIEVARAGGLPRHHPAVRTLQAWSELARDGELVGLLSELWMESGVRQRLYSDAGTRRDAVNLERIFVILRHEVASRPQTADQLVSRLRDWVLGRSREADSEDLLTEVTDPTENAVRILTMHNAKGLEAPVVFLFGGFSGNRNPSVREYHSPAEQGRVLHVGSMEDVDPEKSVFGEEELGDTQRLMYVAMTRAKALCYLQIVADPLPDPGGAGSTVPSGSLFKGAKRTVLDRVDELIAGVDGALGIPQLFEVRVTDERCRDCLPADLPRGPGVAPSVPGHAAELATLVAEAASCLEADGPEAAPWRARIGKPVFSYSSLKKRAEATEDAPLEFAADALPEVPATDPPPGVHTGLCVHELCETVDPAELREFDDVEAWLDRPGRESWIRDALARQELAGELWRRVGQMVYAAFRTPLVLQDFQLPPLADCEDISRELEFRIPYDPALAAGLESILPHPPQDDGWVMGFFDAVLRLQGKIYLVDWKTDLLRDYAPETVAAHVQVHYALQARLYAAALARMLGLGSEKEWEQVYGGFLYVFVRGFGPGTGAVRLWTDWKELSG